MLTCFDTIHECNRRMDGQTDTGRHRTTVYTALCIASPGKTVRYIVHPSPSEGCIAVLGLIKRTFKNIDKEDFMTVRFGC